ncbi:MAG: hypothetical protein M1829_002696 [Trizodia sp. TS-e1964]|nr:MAG: hypothetical protein M1829_002696 [Trizodia sp. TS-e1964]
MYFPLAASALFLALSLQAAGQPAKLATPHQAQPEIEIKESMQVICQDTNLLIIKAPKSNDGPRYYPLSAKGKAFLTKHEKPGSFMVQLTPTGLYVSSKYAGKEHYCQIGRSGFLTCQGKVVALFKGATWVNGLEIGGNPYFTVNADGHSLMPNGNKDEPSTYRIVCLDKKGKEISTLATGSP